MPNNLVLTHRLHVRTHMQYWHATRYFFERVATAAIAMAGLINPCCTTSGLAAHAALLVAPKNNYNYFKLNRATPLRRRIYGQSWKHHQGKAHTRS
jgi:hypothetical protein